MTPSSNGLRPLGHKHPVCQAQNTGLLLVSHEEGLLVYTGCLTVHLGSVSFIDLAPVGRLGFPQDVLDRLSAFFRLLSMLDPPDLQPWLKLQNCQNIHQALM